MKYVILTMVIRPEGDQYVAECTELGTASCGDTESAALDAILDATELYLNTLEDLGQCESVLRERGVPIHSDKPAARKVLRPPPRSSVFYQVLPLQYACA